MKRIKEIMGILIYPIILLAVEACSIVLFTIIFNIINNNEIGSVEYTYKLGNFFANNKMWMVILMFVILIPLFKKKCNIQKIDFNFKIIITLILIGISFGLTYNLILLNLNNVLNFTSIFDVQNTNVIGTLISSGILGPIMEELIFRNIMYEKLKKSYRIGLAVLFTGLIFGIFHGNLIQFIYAFLFNYILILVYEKFKSIYAPIIVHIGANSGLQLFLTYINHENIYISIISLIISAVVLIISYKQICKSHINC